MLIFYTTKLIHKKCENIHQIVCNIYTEVHMLQTLMVRRASTIFELVYIFDKQNIE